VKCTSRADEATAESSSGKDRAPRLRTRQTARVGADCGDTISSSHRTMSSQQITGAVLRQTALPRPYASSQPLALETLQLDPPRADEVGVRIQRGRALPFGSVGARRQPTASAADAAGTRGRRRSGGARRRRARDLEYRRSRGLLFRAVVRPVSARVMTARRPALCEPGAPSPIRRRHAARWREVACAMREGEKLHHHLGVSAFAEYAVVSRAIARAHRSHGDARSGGAVRLRGDDWRGGHRRTRRVCGSANRCS
jgi:hypothetical protein